jgi:hypothetical protein
VRTRVSVCRPVVRGWRSLSLLRHSRPCRWSRTRLEQACMVDADVRSPDLVSAEYVILRRRDGFSRPPSGAVVGPYQQPTTNPTWSTSEWAPGQQAPRGACPGTGPVSLPSTDEVQHERGADRNNTISMIDATRSQEPSADTSAHKKTDVSAIVASRRGQLAQSCRRVARLGPEHRLCDAALAVRGHVHPCGGPGPVRVCDQPIRAIQTDPARLPAPA